VEFRPDSADGRGRTDGLSYRITDRGRRAAAADDMPEDFTPAMTRLGPADLATLETLITQRRRCDARGWPASGPGRLLCSTICAMA
jgi:hypothetical protein